MTREEMKTKLCLANGMGVEVTDNNGTFYYFYEAFGNDFEDCINRIYKHFNHGESLVFYTNKWARQTQFKEYMSLYLQMVKQADEAMDAYEADPMNEEKEKAFDAAYKREFNYMAFLVKEYIEWANVDIQTAKKHIITNQVHYSKFN